MMQSPEAAAIGRERPPLEFDLPEDGMRIRVRAPRRTARLAATLGALAALAAAGLWSASGSAAPPGLLAGLLAGAAVGMFWCYFSLARAYIAFDRHGIHDAAAGLPPLPWTSIERLEILQLPAGGKDDAGRASMLFVHLTPEASEWRIGRWGGLAGLLASVGTRPGIYLPGTRESGLPVPFEYLVLQLYRRGAPIRPPIPEFDLFDSDARWLPARRAARHLADSLGPRARPYVGQHMDIAETRGDRAAVVHWRAVLAALRERAGRIEVED